MDLDSKHSLTIKFKYFSKFYIFYCQQIAFSIKIFVFQLFQSFQLDSIMECIEAMDNTIQNTFDFLISMNILAFYLDVK